MRSASIRSSFSSIEQIPGTKVCKVRSRLWAWIVESEAEGSGALVEVSIWHENCEKFTRFYNGVSEKILRGRQGRQGSSVTVSTGGVDTDTLGLGNNSDVSLARPSKIGEPHYIKPYSPAIMAPRSRTQWIKENTQWAAHKATAWALKNPDKVAKVGRALAKRVNSRQKSQSQLKRGRNNKRRKITGKGLAGKESFTGIYNKPPKKSAFNVIKKIGNTSVYVAQQTNSDLIVAGRQKVTTFSNLVTKPDMQAAWNVASNFYTGSAVVSESNTGAGYQSNKFLLKKAVLKMELSNSSPAVTNMEIWTCMSKVTKPTFVSAASDWTTALNDEGGTAVNTYVGARPTGCKLFNMNWKVKSIHKLQLMGGQQHTNICSFNVNRYIDTEYFNTYEQIRGITISVMIITWGQIGDTSNGYSIGTISTTPCKIIANQTRTYTYEMVNVWPRQIFQGNTTLGQEPLTHLYVLNEESGLVADVQDQAANTAIP